MLKSVRSTFFFISYTFCRIYIELPHGGTIKLETLSVEPRIFKVTNFVSETETDNMIVNALELKTEPHRLQRSTTSKVGAGIGGSTVISIDPFRTSDSAFDVASVESQAIKKRLFEVLGIFPFQDSFTDGFQVSNII